MAVQNQDGIDIDGGAIDGTVIGGNEAAQGNFSELNISVRSTIGSLSLSDGGIITDNSGTISLVSNRLSTSGSINVGSGSTIGDISLSDGSITDTGGNISFGDENLSTTGTLSSGVANLASTSTIGNLTLSDGSITDEGGNISFGNENLTTTGTLNAGAVTVDLSGKSDATNSYFNVGANTRDTVDIDFTIIGGFVDRDQGLFPTT